jgi:gamma-glutamylcyclotransferase (GGCT)/AIG2-like uncharacterized protein YtfP
MTPRPRFVTQSVVEGTLYPLGDYPGLLLGAGHPVLGEVYAIAPELEPLLDAIEGIGPNPRDEYTKRSVEVRSDEKTYPCLVYEVNPKRIKGKALIAHGDWVRHRSQTSD